MRHSIQPLERDKHGVIRFKENTIVSALLDAATKAGVMDLNKIAMMNFPREEHEHFAQLIGYSLSGFSDLSYASEETYAIAERIFHTGTSQTEAENAYLKEKLDKLKAALKEPIADLYDIHPDDLDRQL